MIRFNAENLPLICLLTLCSAVEILLKGINMKMLVFYTRSAFLNFFMRCFLWLFPLNDGCLFSFFVF